MAQMAKEKSEVEIIQPPSPTMVSCLELRHLVGKHRALQGQGQMNAVFTVIWISSAGRI